MLRCKPLSYSTNNRPKHHTNRIKPSIRSNKPKRTIHKSPKRSISLHHNSYHINSSLSSQKHDNYIDNNMKHTLKTGATYKGLPMDIFQVNEAFLDLSPMVLVGCGSFSPITTLHVALFETIRDHLMITSRIGNVIGAYLSPVNDAYGKKSLVHQDHRMAMCRLAVRNINWIGVSSREIDAGCWLETRKVIDDISDILSEVFKDHPLIKQTPQIVFCMGSDVLLGMTDPDIWNPDDVHQLVTKHHIAVITRENDDDEIKSTLLHPLLSPYRSHIHTCPPFYKNNISSTLIRSYIAQRRSIRFMVPDKVMEYIYEQGLYGSNTYTNHITTLTFPQLPLVHTVQPPSTPLEMALSPKSVADIPVLESEPSLTNDTKQQNKH